jgi:hypothetical protein
MSARRWEKSHSGGSGVVCLMIAGVCCGSAWSFIVRPPTFCVYLSENKPEEISTLSASRSRRVNCILEEEFPVLRAVPCAHDAG